MAESGRRVLLGLSGGVDSAVAALLLKEAGYAVSAVRMKIYDGPQDESRPRGCYGRGGAEDERSARETARRLELPFAVIDCSAVWRELVLENFRAEYLAGRTPNPCLRCNELVKFGALPRLAAAAGLEFDYVATGHYARVEPRPEGPGLARGRDRQKDQSYFLYRLSREQLSRVLFPLGDLSKTEVRRLAAARGLAVHDRPDSQDFYGGHYSELLALEDRPGEVVDGRGRVLGRHRGFWHFTPGQRKGLGACGPVPHYVLRVEAESNRVVVGPAAENLYSGAWIEECHFLRPEPRAGTWLRARLRSSQPLQEVRVGPRRAGALAVEFGRPLASLAPGQSLVLYDRQDLVVGGGLIRGGW